MRIHYLNFTEIKMPDDKTTKSVKTGQKMDGLNKRRTLKNIK